mgnify:CR=1 FL=1
MEIDYKDHGKKPYIINIEDATTGNDNYRTTIWTGSKLQVTVMSIQPGDDIGLEVHEGIDQFIRIEEGEGVCKMGPSKDNLHVQQKVMDDAGPDHLEGTVHPTHEDAKNDPNEH